MGLDVGDARIGVALTDPLGLIAQPFSTVETKGGRSHRSIIQLVIEQNVRMIVIGMPLEMSGEIGPQGEKVKEFAEGLKSALARRVETKHVTLELWDERLSTVQAERALLGSGLKDAERSGALDRIAAAVILESYLAGTRPENGG